MNNTVCKIGVGRADIEASKKDVAMNVWTPQASYPCAVALKFKNLKDHSLNSS